MTRRHFNSVLMAAPMVRAAEPARIGIAMIGSGHGHAASKIRALQSMPEFRFVGVCRPDPDDPAANPIFQQVPSLPLDSVLSDSSVELVAMESADPARNLRYAQMAIDAGKYVHLDKPPGASLAGLQKLLDAARAKRRVVQMGYQWRYHPAMNAALEAARNGWLGQVYRFRAAIDKLIGAEERAELAKYRGGMMFSEGCHLVDRATALLGRPVRVSGFLHHHSRLQDNLADNCLMVLEYPQAVAEISLAGFDPQGNEHRLLEIQGTNGTVRVQPYTSTKLTIQLRDAAGPYAAGQQTIQTNTGGGLPYTPDFAEMAAVIRNARPATYSAEHDLITHRVLLEGCGMR